jgi:hypothetical protein
VKTERSDHRKSEDCNCQQSRNSRYRIVEAGSCSGPILIYRTHDNRRQWSHAYRHSDAEDDEAREKGNPVAPTEGWHREQREASSRNERAAD